MFGFPNQTRQTGFHYKNNVLQTVTFQIKFVPQFTIEAKKDEIVAALSEMFPSASQSIRKSTTPKQNSLKTPIVSDEDRPGSLRFESVDGEKILLVEDDSLILTILGTSYTNFATAQEVLDRSLYAMVKLLQVETVNLVAIRKVNGIAVSPVVAGEKTVDDLISTVFNEDLVAHVVKTPPAPKLHSTVTNCRFIEGDNELTIIYGLLPRELEKGVRQVILDIDLINTGQGQSPDYIKHIFSEINAEIFNVFKWAFTPTIEEFLNEA